IPNIAHASVRLALLAGEFRYRRHGLLDDTHLRFFTRETIDELFRESQLEISCWLRRKLAYEETEINVPTRMLTPEIRELLANDPEAATYQFIVRAEQVPASAGPRSLAPSEPEVADYPITPEAGLATQALEPPDAGPPAQ